MTGNNTGTTMGVPTTLLKRSIRLVFAVAVIVLQFVAYFKDCYYDDHISSCYGIDAFDAGKRAGIRGTTWATVGSMGLFIVATVASVLYDPDRRWGLGPRCGFALAGLGGMAYGGFLCSMWFTTLESIPGAYVEAGTSTYCSVAAGVIYAATSALFVDEVFWMPWPENTDPSKVTPVTRQGGLKRI